MTRLTERRPGGEGRVGCDKRSDDQALLQAEHSKWTKIWGMDDPVDPDPWHSDEPGITVPGPADWKAIKAVARSFSWMTSNYEGMSSRHISELPEAGLRQLAQLF